MTMIEPQSIEHMPLDPTDLGVLGGPSEAGFDAHDMFSEAYEDNSLAGIEGEELGPSPHPEGDFDVDATNLFDDTSESDANWFEAASSEEADLPPPPEGEFGSGSNGFDQVQPTPDIYAEGVKAIEEAEHTSAAEVIGNRNKEEIEAIGAAVLASSGAEKQLEEISA